MFNERQRIIIIMQFQIDKCFKYLSLLEMFMITFHIYNYKTCMIANYKPKVTEILMLLMYVKHIIYFEKFLF